MIDFILTKKSNNLFKFRFQIELNNEFILHCNKVDYKNENGNKKLIIIGDCINTEVINLSSDSMDNLLHKLKGNFYMILKQNNSISISSSAFGLLPVYHNQDFTVISSSVSLIKRELSINSQMNKKWIINQLLFNFQFGLDTIFKEIRLFPSFSYLTTDGNLTHFVKYFDVVGSFVEKPLSSKESLDKLSDLFIQTANSYIPDKGSVISFTGGFDGRTLVSVATHYGKSFKSFSYGKPENDDVYLPKKHSKALNIPYLFLHLDKSYSKEHYYPSSIKYIENTDGGIGPVYAHIDYSARYLSKHTRYLISGVCGSELFRAAHSSGAVISKALLNLFLIDVFEEYKESIYASEDLKYIDKKEFKEEIEELVNETWAYKKSIRSSISKNQSLYIFAVEEVFRKFFGAWIKAQMQYINVRTPYIDFDFFKELLKTELSGAYRDFMAENPVKRYKGQLLYARVIRKTNKKLYHLNTGKGYNPKTVDKFWLRPMLLLPFITKRLKRKAVKTNFDNLGIISGIHNNLQLFRIKGAAFINEAEYNKDIEKISPHSKETHRDALLKTFLIKHTYDQYA